MTALRIESLVGLVALALLPSCGIGVAGAVAGAGSDDSGNPDNARVRVLPRASTPVLLDEEPPEPATERADFVTFTVERPDDVAEPSNIIDINFSEPIDPNSVESDDVIVEIQRPFLDYEPVTVLQTVPVNGNLTLRVRLQGDTFLAARYRIRVGGIRGTRTDTVLRDEEFFIVTRAGRWSTPEVVTASFFGADVTLATNRDKYTSFDTQIPGQIPSERRTLLHQLSGEFDLPFQLSSVFMERVLDGTNSEGLAIQAQSFEFAFSPEIGLTTVSEGNPKRESAADWFMIVRKPVATFSPTNGFLDFGPTRFVRATDPLEPNPDQENVLLGRVDLPGVTTSELADAHMSFRGEHSLHDNEATAVFWGLSDPQSFPPPYQTNERFGTQRVYGNDVLVNASWEAWGEASLLSHPDEIHNSWPSTVQAEDGRVFAVWYSTDPMQSPEELFDGVVDKYWLAVWRPQGSANPGWTGAVDITPDSEVGNLPPITDVQFVDVDDAGDDTDRLVFFSRATGAVSGMAAHAVASARVYELDGTDELIPGTWHPARYADVPTFVPDGGTGEVELDEIVPAMRYDDYHQTNGLGELLYRDLEGAISNRAPTSTPLGFGAFAVQWAGQTEPMSSEVNGVVAVFDVVDGWSDPVRLDPTRVSISMTPFNDVRLSVAIASDGHGRLTLIWRELHNGGPTGKIRAQVVNLNEGLGSLADLNLADGMVERVTLSDVTFDAKTPTVTGVHSSGAFAVNWRESQIGSGGEGATMARFR